jgi:hypothetical protein
MVGSVLGCGRALGALPNLRFLRNGAGRPCGKRAESVRGSFEAPVDEHVLHILLGFAGVGATFAGFSGVVAVFGRRAHGEWLPEDLFRLRNLMFMSLGVCLLAFAPLVLITWHFGDALTWALASMLLGAGSIVYLLYARPASRHLRRDRPGLMPTWASAVFIVALCVTAILQFLNIVGLFLERGAGPYLAGLLALLCAAAMQFAFLVIRPLSSVASD